MSRSESTRYARAILDAWDQQDVHGFTRHLESAVAFCAAPGDSGGEDERRELLGGIAGEMLRGVRLRPSQAEAETLPVYLDLLRHLAGRGPRRSAARPRTRIRIGHVCHPFRAESFTGNSRHSSI